MSHRNRFKKVCLEYITYRHHSGLCIVPSHDSDTAGNVPKHNVPRGFCICLLSLVYGYSEVVAKFSTRLQRRLANRYDLGMLILECIRRQPGALLFLNFTRKIRTLLNSLCFPSAIAIDQVLYCFPL